MTARFLTCLHPASLVPALMLCLSMPAVARSQHLSSVLKQGQKNELKRLSKNIKKGQQNLKKAQGVLRANKVVLKAKGVIPPKQSAKVKYDENQVRRTVNQLKHTKKAQAK
ncbi:MAG: hypothetical protein ACRD2B_13050 [Terriglobia bacterium]